MKGKWKVKANDVEHVVDAILSAARGREIARCEIGDENVNFADHLNCRSGTWPNVPHVRRLIIGDEPFALDDQEERRDAAEALVDLRPRLVVGATNSGVEVQWPDAHAGPDTTLITVYGLRGSIKDVFRDVVWTLGCFGHRVAYETRCDWLAPAETLYDFVAQVARDALAQDGATKTVSDAVTKADAAQTFVRVLAKYADEIE